MKTQKCCSHCPGKLISQRSNEFHECCQPNYVTGSLKVSSLKKRVPEPFGRKKMERSSLLPANQTSHDQFALAKRLHAENLQHQPLPDKVHDSVFENPRPAPCCLHSSRKYCECHEQGCKKPSKHYGPALGCKEPKTKMDLAICWETPVNPVYEPPRPTHIDGSEGGLAPAIFNLVEHAANSPRDTLRPRTARNEDVPGCRGSERDPKPPRNEHEEEKRTKCCCECLCEGLDRVHVSEKNEVEPRSRRSFRKCVACESKDKDPRLIRSAVGLALGLEKNGDGRRRNDGKVVVPRPRTPFAKRSFCIDTLAPPFNVVNGCRDADYPEHWRLMSVYQQSYKNPYRRRSYYRC